LAAPLGGAAAGGGEGAPAKAEVRAWAETARLDTAGALRTFRELAETGGGGGAAARYGEAVVLLNLQPKTERNVARAEALLEEVRGAAGDEDLVRWAEYQLARAAQWHRVRPDPRAAERRYRDLVSAAPAHPAAQLAAVKLALLIAYDPRSPAPAADRLREAEALGRSLTLPDARRDFHLSLARAAQYFELPAPVALEHLLAAEATGAISTFQRGGVLVAIGQLAAASDRPAEAARAFRQFLREFPRDTRTRAVRDRLAALGIAEGAP
jgi:hypothetical protein